VQADAFIFVLKKANTGIHRMACISPNRMSHLRMSNLRLPNVLRNFSFFSPIYCKNTIADLIILCLRL
jgi:hypothetical protein